MRKLRISLVKSSSTLFSFSICAIYNRVNISQKQHLMFNLYLPGINSMIFPKRDYNNIFPEKYSMNYTPG